MYHFSFTGSFSWFFVVAGTHKSLGVLYVDLLELFQEGAFATSLVSMVFTFAWCLPCKLLKVFSLDSHLWCLPCKLLKVFSLDSHL